MPRKNGIRAISSHTKVPHTAVNLRTEYGLIAAPEVKAAHNFAKVGVERSNRFTRSKFQRISKCRTNVRRFVFVGQQALGHADTRMVDKHCAHLAPSYVADTIRRMAPDF
jgi:hypothetical protein